MVVDINKKKLKKQVETLYFKTDCDVLRNLLREYEEFENMLNHLKSINVKGVVPMTRIDETPILNLREDIAQEEFNYYSFLKNAPETKNGYVIINNMVNDD